MWLRRLAALALAVALVAGAFAVRRARDDGNSGASGSSPTGPVGPGTTIASGNTPAGNGFTLVCAKALATLCDGVKVDARRNEASVVTATAFAQASDPRSIGSAWLTVDPWPGLSDLARPAGGSTFAPASRVVLAHSPVGVAVRAERVTALKGACGGAVTLACVGTKGGTEWASMGGQATWKTFKPSMDDPVESVFGPISLAAAVREQRKDTGLTLIDLTSDPATVSWVRGFVRPSDPSASPLEEALVRPTFDAVILPQAEFRALAGSNPTFSFEGTSAFSAELVLVAPDGVKIPTATVDALRAAAIAAGWQAGAAPTAGVDANLVAGMQRLWKENPS